jgi:cell division protein FtsQ
MKGAGRGWLDWLRPQRSVKEQVLEEPIPMPPRPSTLSARRAERHRLRHEEENRPAERVRPSGVIWISWRWVSGIMTALLILVLYGLFAIDAFYVSSIGVSGVNYLAKEDIFRFTGVADKHIFWIDPDEVREQLESNNNIAAADVRVSWGEQTVQIIIQERDPVLIWEQDTERVWVDINGIVMYQREDRPDLLRIVYDSRATDPESPPESLGAYSRIDKEIVHGALLLRSRLPHIDVLLYDPLKGLGWRDPRGWTAWFGIGDNMAMKALVYEATIAKCGDEVQFNEIDVADPDFPLFTYLYLKQEQPQNDDCVAGN